ncbi:MAG: glycosyltransferase [Nocardioidaceae bacterium]|nr:glycosyltransferase [Nocardioidaceae bacterium]
MTRAHDVVAVVVTWNRKQLLIGALDAVAEQDPAPKAVVVVDNASTDGTAAAVRERVDAVDLMVSDTNTGGAGGFATGVARALAEHDPDVLWLMDDDTVPQPGALAELLRAYDSHRGDPDGRRPALVASRVVWTDGRVHPMNTPRPKPGARRPERRNAAAIGCVPIRSASFVSVLCDAAAVRERGLPVADYFLWNDDFEFTTRLLRGRTGLLCPSSLVEHRTATFGSTDADPGERFYYEVRNKTWVFTRSSGLSPAEKALYAGATLRRWARTFRVSSDRGPLWRGLRRGLVAGVRAGPRPNTEVLGG